VAKVAPIPAIDELLVRLRDLKRTIATAEEQRVGKNQDGVECQLAALLKEWGIQHASVLDGPVKITGTLVESSGLTIDEHRLQRAVGATNWQKITSRVLDKAKLEDAIARGLVDATLVAECSAETPRRPYVKIQERPLSAADRMTSGGRVRKRA
jgi:hypothetical protein